jgi:hypothetical protein
MRVVLFVLLPLLLGGCAAHRAHVIQGREPPNPSFLEIQAGTRLRVITPILKSGGYVTKLTEITPGNPRNLRVGDDYIGYADDYYVARRHGSGVRIEFQSADTVKQGRSSPQSHPTLELFRLSPQMRFVRIVYIARVSSADHNMAIVAADNEAAVEASTKNLRTDPNAGCQRGQHSSCLWVPVGVGIQPEIPTDSRVQKR